MLISQFKNIHKDHLNEYCYLRAYFTLKNVTLSKGFKIKIHLLKD